MSNSRRDFLKKGTLVALTAGVPLTAAEAVFGAKESTSAREPRTTKDQFASQLNTEFVFVNGRREVRTRLVEVNDLPTPANYTPRRGKEGFSLLFRGPRAGALTQETYTIDHAKLGRFSFFVVPTRARDDDTVYYEAVVNRLYP